MEDRIIHGFWWLPGKKKEKISGIFFATRDKGLLLELEGNINEEKIIDIENLIILGEDSFGEKITIFQPIQYQSTFSVSNPEGGKSFFRVTRAFIGYHFPKKERIKFDWILYEPYYLLEWMNKRVLNREINSNGFTLIYKHPDNIEIYNSENTRIQIGYGFIGPKIGLPEANSTFSQNAFFIIETKNKSELCFFTNVIIHLDNFLSLTTSQPIFPMRLEGFIKEKKAHFNHENESKVEIIAPELIEHEQERINFTTMLFTYKDIQTNFSEYAKNWFDKKNIMEPILNLFFSPLYSIQKNTVITFLNLTQALETYHIRFFTGEIETPEIQKKLVESILKNAPPEHLEWLKEKLTFPKRPYFAARLKELIKSYPYPVIGRHGSIDYFINDVKNSRNYYTHYDPSLEKKAAKGGYLKGIVLTLGLLLQAFVLKELGIDLVSIREMQKNHGSNIYYWV
jgi:hypothetical protein